MLNALALAVAAAAFEPDFNAIDPTRAACAKMGKPSGCGVPAVPKKNGRRSVEVWENSQGTIYRNCDVARLECRIVIKPKAK